MKKLGNAIITTRTNHRVTYKLLFFSCYFQWPNWVYSTGLRFVLRFQFFMFSSLLLFSLVRFRRISIFWLWRKIWVLSLAQYALLLNLCLVLCCCFSLSIDVLILCMSLLLYSGWVWISPLLCLFIWIDFTCFFHLSWGASMIWISSIWPVAVGLHVWIFTLFVLETCSFCTWSKSLIFSA